MARFSGTLVQDPTEERRPRFSGTPVMDITEPDPSSTPAEPTVAPAQAPVPQQPQPNVLEQAWERLSPSAKAMYGTVQRIGEVLPVAENAAQIVTSAYGLPVSGAIALASLPFVGLDRAGDILQGTQDLLIYNPQTVGGQELQRTVGAPGEAYQRGVTAVTDPMAESMGPNVAATAKTVAEALPIALGAKLANIRSAPQRMTKTEAKFNRTTDKTLARVLKPTTVGKKTRGGMQRYFYKGRRAVQDLVRNKDNLKYVDDVGNERTGLPRSLDEFSQAIEQRKREVFEEYDRLATHGTLGSEAKLNLRPIIRDLDRIAENKGVQASAPETIRYIKSKKEALPLMEDATALELQEAITILNNSLEGFYKNPSPAAKGRAIVDSAIADHLRRQLDARIRDVTNKDYAGLKRLYGAYKALEADLTKQVLLQRKTPPGGGGGILGSASDIALTGGAVTFNPKAIATGLGLKAVKKTYDIYKDPNRMVSSYFERADKLMKRMRDTQLDDGQLRRRRMATRGAAVASQLPSLAGDEE